jgi:hypothetical protein
VNGEESVRTRKLEALNVFDTIESHTIELDNFSDLNKYAFSMDYAALYSQSNRKLGIVHIKNKSNMGIT